MYDQGTPPVQQWQLLGLSGSRDEGGYTASFKVFEDVSLQENAIVVLFGDSYYGNSHINMGGNYPNGEDIFWAGYVDRDTIQYDDEHSEVSFSAQSITALMKNQSGFVVSVESVSNPKDWYELLDMDGRRALYHYLRWHTTALQVADFQFVGDDYKIQFYDSNRESMYNAIDNFMRNTLVGQVTSDRQGKVWMEIQGMAYLNPTGTFVPIMDITDRDWMNTPSVSERLSPEVSYLEYGGIAYSGTVTGTYSAVIASAPGSSPGFRGTVESHQGQALAGQEFLNQIVGNVLANKNSQYPSVDMDLTGNYSNLDIAPQEALNLNIPAANTVRGKAINGLFLPESMSWNYVPDDFILLPQITMAQLVSGDPGETVEITVPEDIGAGYNVPSPTVPSIPAVSLPAFGSGITNLLGNVCKCSRPSDMDRWRETSLLDITKQNRVWN